MKIKVITLYQPWASWIMWGWKTIETRTHNKFNGLKGQIIGIHSSKRFDEYAYEAAEEFLDVSQRLTYWGRIQHTPKHVVCPAGQLLGTAFVCDTRELRIADQMNALIECGFTRRNGLFLKDVKVFANPIPMPGHQGIWEAEIPDELVRAECKTE